MSNGIPIYQLSKLLISVEELATISNKTKKPPEYLNYIFEIYSDGLLQLSHAQQSEKNVTVSLLKVMIESDLQSTKATPDQTEFAIHCQAISGQRMVVRCICTEKQQYEIFHAIKEVSKDHNIDNLLPPLSPLRPAPTLPTDVTASATADPFENNQLHLQQGQSDIVIYQNDHLYFSAIRERNIRMAVVWKPWEARTVKLTADGVLTYQKPKRKIEIPRYKMFSCKDIEVTLMADNDRDDITDYGLIVRCHTLDHIESYFRCILDETELDSFLNALKSVAEHHNIDSLVRSQLTVEKKKKRFYLLRSKQNVMRRAVTRAMDKFDMRTKRERIISKRGAFRWLPVAGQNDLIHGSWWYVYGSIGAVITSIVILQNKDYPFWNTDDSTLSAPAFMATWILMCFSGIFSTLGSLAFVRAFHENPPMSPLFPRYYHIQSDELLASWLFFLATLPFVPYCIIFMAADNFNNLAFLVLLLLAILACIVTLLFVRACYPTTTEKNYPNILLPLSNWCCFCCCNEQWRKAHFMNDWLGGTWIFLWATEVGSLGCFILFAIALAENNTLQIWMYGTSFIEAVMFLIGSAYFVAGSYPEGYNAIYGGEDSPGINNLEAGLGGNPQEVYNPVAMHETIPISVPPPPSLSSTTAIISNTNSHDRTYDHDEMEQIGYQKPKKEPILWKPNNQRKGMNPIPMHDDFDEEII